MSANSDESSKRNSLASGMDNFISKPFKLDRFLELVALLCPVYTRHRAQSIMEIKGLELLDVPSDHPVVEMDDLAVTLASVLPLLPVEILPTILPRLPVNVLALVMSGLSARLLSSIVPDLPLDVLTEVLPLLPRHTACNVSALLPLAQAGQLVSEDGHST